MGDLLTGLLDRQYVRETDAVIRAIGNGSTTGIIDQRLKELDEESARLQANGKRLTADNPVVRALVADFEDVMRANSALVNTSASTLQTSGMNAAATITGIMSKAVNNMNAGPIKTKRIRGFGLPTNPLPLKTFRLATCCSTFN